MMLDVYELKVFLTAAETENFSETARQLSLTQPAVSMQMRALEKKLGFSLFHRAGRSLALTEQGRVLVPMARDMVKRSIQIEEELEALKGDVIGNLKIGCSTTTGKYYLPSLVARFRQRYPKVQVVIRNRSRDLVLSDLQEGEVHLAIVSAYPSIKDVECRRFFDDHMILVVSASHPWAQRASITPDDLRGTDFILRDTHSGTREGVDAALSHVGLIINDLNVVLEIGNSEAMGMAVEEGIGAAFISRTVARRGIDLGKLKEISVEGLSLQREIFIAYSRRHPASRAQTEFYNFIREPDRQRYLESVA